MPYTKQTWVDGSSQANAARLNHMEDGIDQADLDANVSDAVIFHNGTNYPLRNTVTTNASRRVRWVGPTAPTIGGGYAIDNLDVWEQTA